jgi:hypothetical protein
MARRGTVHPLLQRRFHEARVFAPKTLDRIGGRLRAPACVKTNR